MELSLTKKYYFDTHFNQNGSNMNELLKITLITLFYDWITYINETKKYIHRTVTFIENHNYDTYRGLV